MERRYLVVAPQAAADYRVREPFTISHGGAGGASAPVLARLPRVVYLLWTVHVHSTLGVLLRSAQ